MDALHAYQKKNMVFPGDTALGPGSTTERILNEDFARAGGEGAYVWRTVGDGKVRGEHAARNCRAFLWADPPDGENPGEDYNCRCWAEPLNTPSHPWKSCAIAARAKKNAARTIIRAAFLIIIGRNLTRPWRSAPERFCRPAPCSCGRAHARPYRPSSRGRNGWRSAPRGNR